MTARLAVDKIIIKFLCRIVVTGSEHNGHSFIVVWSFYVSCNGNGQYEKHLALVTQFHLKSETSSKIYFV